MVGVLQGIERERESNSQPPKKWIEWTIRTVRNCHIEDLFSDALRHVFLVNDRLNHYLALKRRRLDWPWSCEGHATARGVPGLVLVPGEPSFFVETHIKASYLKAQFMQHSASTDFGLTGRLATFEADLKVATVIRKKEHAEFKASWQPTNYTLVRGINSTEMEMDGGVSMVQI